MLQNMKYKINEIFKSYQGEGFNLGKEVTFIRMSGCNKNCSWCDTKHQQYSEKTIKEILKKIECNSVIITGGEPTEQNLLPLLKELKNNVKWIGIETNGTNDIKEIRKYLDYIAFSPKDKNIHKSFIELADEIRIVNDNLTIEDVLYYENWKIKNRFISVLEKDGKYNLLDTFLLVGKINERSGHNWKINQQIHKILKIR